ncbi:MAG: DUF1588 domain-containing protein [Haliangiales bacterium]
MFQSRKQLSSVRVALALALALALAACGGADSDQEGGVVTPPAGQPCPPSEEEFVATIWTPILSLSCVSCHNAEGVAKDSAMVLARPTEADFLSTNFDILSELATRELDGTSILLLRPTGRHPQGHPGGVLFDVGSNSYEAMETFVGRVTGDPDACARETFECQAGTPGRPMLRRLSRTEYDRTVRDLLGTQATLGATFTADTVINGYDNNAEALTVSSLLAGQVREAAEKLAAEAVSDRLDALLPCDRGAGAACVEEFTASFGARAFRRPLTDDEVARYAALFDVGADAADGGSFEVGIELVIAAMLQSPHFLYRSELGAATAEGRYQLNDYEIASQLSYFLWGSMPDDALFAAAEAGTLTSPEEIEAQARRMLDDPKSRSMIERFTVQWLGTDQIGVVPKDSAAYPELTGEVRAAMDRETRDFVADVVLSGGTFSDLMQAQVAAEGVLAELYASPGDGASEDLDAAAEDDRSGLLTLGAVLTTHARPNASSPIHRGKLVRERLLCQHLPPPPPGVNAEPPAFDPSLTTRERYSQHSSDEACAGCHRLMDPIGFGFENYDGIGRYRGDENGLAIDVSGTIHETSAGDVTFVGTSGLAETLAASADAHDCFVLQWVRYAYGVEEDRQLDCLIEEVQAEFDQSGGTVEDLIIALTQTSHFTSRLDPFAALPGDGGGDPGDGGGDPGDGGGDPGDGGGDPGDGGGDPGDGGGDPGDGPGDSGDQVDVAVVVDSQWETGSCHSATVTNLVDTDVTWQVTLTVDGVVNNFWNSLMSQSGSEATFSGESYNAVIPPGGSASFGFCVTF